MSGPIGLQMDFVMAAGVAPSSRSVHISSLVIAGWTGRDPVAVAEHIAELQREGISPPAATPMFYRVGVSLLTTAADIQVVGTGSTGEIEAFLLQVDGEPWVGVGSDHTDRKLEAVSVVMSKQACPKPIGRTLWRYSDVCAHWDDIEVRSYRYEGEKRIPYQRGTLARNLRADELRRRYEHAAGAMTDGTLLFCGTIPAEGGIRFSRRFEMTLHDPVRDRSMHHAYDVLPLPGE